MSKLAYQLALRLEKETARLNWFIKYDNYGRNRRFVDAQIKWEKTQKAKRR